MQKHEPRMLIVDDERDICDNLADIFSDFGYNVQTACDGPSALALARQETFDIALLDLRMPGMSGLELFKQLKDISQGTAAVIVTAYASSETAREAVEAGAWGVMSKPVDLPSLFKAIEEALGQPIVLIVDDDGDLCQSLRDVLLQRKYRVCVAHDLPEAKEQLQRRDFQVVLLDLKLPAGNGTELLHAVQLGNPETRTILITGHRLESDNQIDSAMASGANAICYKPFDVPKLLNMIRELTDS